MFLLHFYRIDFIFIKEAVIFSTIEEIKSWFMFVDICLNCKFPYGNLFVPEKKNVLQIQFNSVKVFLNTSQLLWYFDYRFW